MKNLSKKLIDRYYSYEQHPYYIFESIIKCYLKSSCTLLDAGCGRHAEFLVKYKDKVKRAIGVDLVEFDPGVKNIGLELLQSDLMNIELKDGSVDLIISRSVMEHLEKPLPVFTTLHRILRPGGRFIFLTPNLGDYVSIFAKLIPNRFHPWIVARTEGRKEEDTFPTFYRSNTHAALTRLAMKSNFKLVSCRYLGQCPHYFQFNSFFFLIAMAYEKITSKSDSLKTLRPWLLVELIRN